MTYSPACYTDVRTSRSCVQILQSHWRENIKVPITPKNFFCPAESLCHAEQNGEKIFVFGQNWNFL